MTPAEFVANFETIAEASGGIKKLREMILDLAMRGRIVAQDPKDEPASSLISRLRKTPLGGRVQHVPTTAIDPPYEIERSWQWCHFTDVVSIESCLVDPSGFLKMPHVAPDNIEKGTGRLLPYNTIGQDGVTSSKHRFYPGQILYSKIRPNLSKVVIVDFEGLCSADMYPLAAKIDTRFLHLFMLSPEFLRQVVREDNRLAMPKVNQQQLSETVVAVPPLAEQKRIVAKVDQLMALCDDLEARQAKKRETAVRLNRAALDALTTAEGPEEVAASFRRVAENFDLVVPVPESMGQLRNAILSLAVQGRLVAPQTDDEPVGTLLKRVSAYLEQGKSKARVSDDFDPVDSEVAAVGPAHWRWEKLGRLAEVVGGVTKGRDLRGRRVVSYPYLRVANVQRGELDLTVMKEIEVAPEELPRYALRPGDVLFTEGGDWDKLGRSAVWEGQVDPCLHQNHVFRARFSVVDLHPRWFSMYANSPLGRRYFEGAAKRTTNLASINMTQLRNCPMPVPPTKEQKRIVAKVDQLMALCDTLEAALRRAESTAQKLAEAVVAEIVA